MQDAARLGQIIGRNGRSPAPRPPAALFFIWFYFYDLVGLLILHKLFNGHFVSREPSKTAAAAAASLTNYTISLSICL